MPVGRTACICEAGPPAKMVVIEDSEKTDA